MVQFAGNGISGSPSGISKTILSDEFVGLKPWPVIFKTVVVQFIPDVTRLATLGALTIGPICEIVIKQSSLNYGEMNRYQQRQAIEVEK